MPLQSPCNNSAVLVSYKCSTGVTQVQYQCSTSAARLLYSPTRCRSSVGAVLKYRWRTSAGPAHHQRRTLAAPAQCQDIARTSRRSVAIPRSTSRGCPAELACGSFQKLSVAASAALPQESGVCATVSDGVVEFGGVGPPPQALRDASSPPWRRRRRLLRGGGPRAATWRSATRLAGVVPQARRTASRSRRSLGLRACVSGRPYFASTSATSTTRTSEY